MHVFTIIVYVAGFGAAIALELFSRRHPDSIAPVGTMLDAVLADRAARMTLIVFWWWLGWHFLAGQTV